jgi:hypothetical protein
MIAKALQITCNIFNQYLKNKFILNEDIVVINRIVNSDGNHPIENSNKIVVSLIHVDQETNKQFYSNRKLQTGSFSIKSNSERYNLFILITPNFENYEEGLKFLSATLQFFQNNNKIDANKSSLISKDIQQLDFELEKGENYMQMQNLWTALGAKYQPSLIYKIRLIPIVSDEVEGFDTSIERINTDATL